MPVSSCNAGGVGQTILSCTAVRLVLVVLFAAGVVGQQTATAGNVIAPAGAGAGAVISNDNINIINSGPTLIPLNKSSALHVAFLGASHVFFGDLPWGFIKLFKSQLPNVTTTVIGSRNASSVEVLNDLKNYLKEYEQQQEDRNDLYKSGFPSHVTELSKIDVAVVMLGNDDLRATAGLAVIAEPPQALPSMHLKTPLQVQVFNLHTILVTLQLANITTVLTTPFTHGDKIDGTNELDDILEEYTGSIMRLHEEFQGMHFVDVNMRLQKHLEERNIENLPHSTVTYDGIHLNEDGHKVVAMALLEDLGLDEHSISIPFDPAHELRIINWRRHRERQ
jgi:lysophospholipase L1-like esterase